MLLERASKITKTKTTVTEEEKVLNSPPHTPTHTTATTICGTMYNCIGNPTALPLHRCTLPWEHFKLQYGTFHVSLRVQQRSA